MEPIQTIVDSINIKIETVNAILVDALEKKLSYNRAKDIRKAAQEVKVLAQQLRVTTMEIYKKLKEQQ